MEAAGSAITCLTPVGAERAGSVALDECVHACAQDTCQRVICYLQVAEDKDVMVIDSRCGEDFAAFAPDNGDGSGPAITPRFDACASWWTQVSGTHAGCWRDVGSAPAWEKGLILPAA